jgi:hypothetical protein
MAKPGRFELQNPDDLLAKAKRERQRLEAVADAWEEEEGDSDDDWYQKQVEHQSDHAFNFSVTVWHITDWFCWHVLDQVSGLTAKQTEKALADFQIYVRSKSPALSACYDLARGAKHFEIARAPAGVSGTDVATRSGFSSGFSDEFERRRVTLRVIDRTGSPRPVEDLFAEALSDIDFHDWERFFRNAGYPI